MSHYWHDTKKIKEKRVGQGMHATLTHQGCCFGWSGSPACSKADTLVQVTVSCLRSKVPNTAHQSWKRESHSPNGTRTSSGTGTSSKPGPRRTQCIRCTAGWRRPCCEAWWACPGAEPRRPGEYLGRPQRTQLNVHSFLCISQRYVYRKLPYSSCPWRTTSPCLGRGLSGVRVKWDGGGVYPRQGRAAFCPPPWCCSTHPGPSPYISRLAAGRASPRPLQKAASALRSAVKKGGTGRCVRLYM